MIRNQRLCQASWIPFYGSIKGIEKDKTYWKLDRNKGFMVSAYYCILVGLNDHFSLGKTYGSRRSILEGLSLFGLLLWENVLQLTI